MKKNLFLSTLATAAVMMLTGCSQEEIVQVSGGDTMVNFSVEAPQGLNARAVRFGTGTTATKLSYAVYDKAGNLLSAQGEPAQTDFENLKANVSLKLVKGDQYSVVFWADAGDDSPYTVNWTTKKMTFKEGTTISANDEKRDAFYNKVTFVVVGDANRTVTLTRPFAQLNIGTNDMTQSTAAGFTPTKTQVTVTGVPNTLDLFSGNVDGSTSVTYAYNNMPASDEDFPVTGYQYLSMNYILTGVDKTTTDVTFNYSNEANANHSRTFAAVPIQRNYRTNIYGSLLTNTITYDVNIEPAFTANHDVKAQQDLDNQAAIAGSSITLPQNTVLNLPDNIADNVQITGAEGSVLVVDNNGVTGNNLQLSNVQIQKDNTQQTTRGINNTMMNSSLIIVSGKNVTFDNVTFKDANKYLYTFVTTNADVNLTIKNTDFSTACYSGYGVYIADKGTHLNLENCNFPAKLMYAINGAGGAVNAKGCTFRGWISGWQDGGWFEDCTFDYGNIWYPCAICYGTTTFKGCTFMNYGVNLVTDGSETVVTPTERYKYTYSVSCGTKGIDIVFDNCQYNNDAEFGTRIFYRQVGDGKQDPASVTINGKKYTDIIGNFLLDE